MAEQLTQLALALLLGLNAVWCVLLHQRLRRLRSDGASLGKFVAEIDAVIARAEEILRGLRSECAAIESRLRRQSDNARRRGDELKRVCDLAGELTRRLQAEAPAVERPPAPPASRRPREDEPIVRRPTPRRDTRGMPASEGAGAATAAPDADRAELLRLLERLR